MNFDKRKFLILLLPLLLFIIFEYPYYTFNKSIILSILIIYSVYFILLSLFKKVKIAILILGMVLYIIQVINIGKMQFICDPFYFSDIFYTGDMTEILNIIRDDFVNTLVVLLPKLLIILFFTILVIIYSFKSNIVVLNIKKRIIVFCTGLICLLFLFLPIESVDKFLMNIFYSNKDYLNHVKISSGDDYYKYYGHLSGMYGNYLESFVYKPDDYNKSVIYDELINAPKVEDSTFGKPNIIVIFSESFFDIDKIDELEFDKRVTKNYNELKEKGLSFQMLAPFYGGMSSNVEFEFLTGGTTNYYSSSFVPYMELYDENSYYYSPSIISELHNNDYYTKIVAYYSSKLYNCGKVYNYMDIDDVDFVTDVDTKYIKGQYISDEYVVDNIIDALENKDDKPLFYMTMTMQSHMPYLISKYDNYDIELVNSNLDDKYNESLISYAQGIYDADKELGRLYDYINTLDEDTIIVFYGDHLPYLEAFNYLDYFNTDDDKLNAFRKYNTESLIIANYDISGLKDDNVKYLGPDLLSSYILNHMDIKVSDYYRWLYSTIDTIGTSNRYVSVNQDGKIYFTSKLKGKYKELYDLRRNVQYKFFNDFD